jgi:hypothetical protein
MRCFVGGYKYESFHSDFCFKYKEGYVDTGFVRESALRQ